MDFLSKVIFLWYLFAITHTNRKLFEFILEGDNNLIRLVNSLIQIDKNCHYLSC